jgi:glutamate racemase
VAGDEIQVIDTGLAVTAQLRRRLAENDLLSAASFPGDESFWCSGSLDEMRKLLMRLWRPDAEPTALPDQANRS